MVSGQPLHIIRDGRDVVVSHWFNELQNLALEDEHFQLNSKHSEITDEFVETSISTWVDNIITLKRDITFFPNK